jgi:hypothetical protein
VHAVVREHRGGVRHAGHDAEAGRGPGQLAGRPQGAEPQLVDDRGRPFGQRGGGRVPADRFDGERARRRQQQLVGIEAQAVRGLVHGEHADPPRPGPDRDRADPHAVDPVHAHRAGRRADLGQTLLVEAAIDAA